MTAITTVTSREFNQDTGRAKRASNDGPVFITDRGRPAHVLLSIEEYRRMADRSSGTSDACRAERPRTLLEALAQPGDEHDFVADFPRSRELPREIDFGLG